MLSEIETRDELAYLLNVKHSVLTYVLYIAKPSSYYYTFHIPKKNGGFREINASQGILKTIQKKLIYQIESCQEYCFRLEDRHTNIAHAFTKGKGIITNARIHKNKRIIVNIDLKDFFHAIHFGRVKGYFEKNRYFQLPSEIATIIAQLTCYKGHLPQGAPSSPIITNLICQSFDYHVLKIAKKYRLDYTRYADDLTFSTNWSQFPEEFTAFFAELKKEISRNGFTVNEAKTRLVNRESKQTVTGLTVNKKINADRSFYKSTRAMLDSLYKNRAFSIDDQPGTLCRLEGRFSFIDDITHYNNKNDGNKHDIYRLSGREKDYQKFLFYKYFIANEKPVIATEGKTDVLYIKSALKNMHERYPSLITKKQDGTFSFSVSFLRRSVKKQYFFNMSPDGADSLKNIYQFFTGKQSGFSNYYKMLSNPDMDNAVILLFDNEQSANYPLKKFLDSANLNASQITNLREKHYTRIVGNSKLFLVTTPLVQGKDKTEMEDLFTQTTLNTVIDGKHFTTDNKYDSSMFYGKDRFSKYVYANYATIDFSGFIPLLDAIVKAIKTK